MKPTTSSGSSPETSPCPQWGLKRTITPQFGARLVQEGNRLHYLADRAVIAGKFTDAQARQLDQAFPLIMKQLELMLTSGEPSTLRHAVPQRVDMRGGHTRLLRLRLSRYLSGTTCHRHARQRSLKEAPNEPYYLHYGVSA